MNTKNIFSFFIFFLFLISLAPGAFAQSNSNYETGVFAAYTGI